jgi:proteic killer suppression protein
MEITFINQRLQKLCNSASKLIGEYGPKMATKIQQRLAELAAADNLEQLRNVPGHYHELSQNLAGLLAVSLIQPDRLAFKPTDSPRPQKADGGLDWSMVTKVTIVGIGDYHGS